MDGPQAPRSPEELAALEARYRPIDGAAAWSEVSCDEERWRRHAEALRAAQQRADPEAWERLRAGFLQAAALDSSALAQMIRPVPNITTVVLSTAIAGGDWSSIVDATSVIVECHRRALVVATDAADAGRPLDVNSIALMQDLIVESQQTYTVTTDGRDRQEVELPRRQYKPTSNFLLRSDFELVPFAPASEVDTEMRRLTDELASEDFGRLHPVVQSAYSHVALIRIHPYADGNGRLARTLACVPLLTEVGLPPIVLADQWPSYTRALLESDDGDPQGLVELFLAAHINSMDLARNLLESADSKGHPVPVVTPVAPVEQLLLDLVAFHLREAIGVPAADRRVSLSPARTARDTVKLMTADSAGSGPTEIEFSVAPDNAPGWLRLVSSAGDVLEISREDMTPGPVEIVHIRVRAWLDGVLLRGHHGLADSAPIRGLFVLGVPRSGTTLMGNWLGSHPDVLGLGEYGAFYIANSVAPAYLNRLPGSHHEPFLRELRLLTSENVARSTRRQGCSWFCDATPWNLAVAAAIRDDLPDAIFVLMLRHFSGAIVSLRQFPWAGDSWTEAARIWADLNNQIDLLPEDRTVVIGYDVLASHPAETIDAIREAIQLIGLAPEQLDDTQLARSHAHIIGEPRPTIARLDGSQVSFNPIPSLDAHRWTPEVHAEVWPLVAETHRLLLDRFGGVYESPPRPVFVPDNEW